MAIETIQQGIVALLSRIPISLEYGEPRAKLHAAMFHTRTRPEDVTPEWWEKKQAEVQQLLEDIEERNRALL